jgi:hypothetical protein
MDRFACRPIMRSEMRELTTNLPAAKTATIFQRASSSTACVCAAHGSVIGRRSDHKYARRHERRATP